MDDYIKICRHLFPHGFNTIMEVGALDGKDSLLFKKEYPGAIVYCIEGNPDNYHDNIENLDGVIVPINAVVSNHIGYVDYYIKDINGIHGIFDRGKQYGTKVKHLSCTTISEIGHQYNITSIDMLKIDVEGATSEILQGMEDLLYSVKIMHIETESGELFKGQKCHEEVVDYLILNNFYMTHMISAEIEPNKLQHDSVWINRSIKNV